MRLAPTGTKWAWDRPTVVRAAIREVSSCMDNLVLCPCGHSLAVHDYTGCSGDRVKRCACAHDRHAALEAAVDSVRTEPVFSHRYELRGDDAA